MASGDSVVQILEITPPAANAATLDYIQGGSTPAENFLVRDFDSTTVEYADYLCKLAGYEAGGLTFTFFWSADGVTTGNVYWSIGIRRIADDAEDVDVSHSYDYNNIAAAAPSVDGEVAYTTLTFTDGADMDSWTEGEIALVRVRRFATDGADTMNSNDAELWGIVGLET